jgi:hypothetical protein
MMLLLGFRHQASMDILIHDLACNEIATHLADEVHLRLTIGDAAGWYI